MVEVTYPDGPRFDYCPDSGGLWFDSRELKALLDQDKNIRLQVDRKTMEPPEREEAADHPPEDHEARRPAPSRPGLLPLPNLFLRSTVTLAGLYALLGAILIAAVEFAGLDVGVAVGVGVSIVVVQFLIGPFLMDLSLRWLYRMHWVSSAELPEHLRRFVARVCGEKGMKFPRFGIIDDGAPQAFTYGHTPNNARLVISRGILELLEPEEAEAVVAHELGHAVHWDMFLMTIAQLVPLLLYYLYRTLIRVRTSGRGNKGGGARVIIAIGAYVLYIISEYIVLWFSRTREYHADRFSGVVTGYPSRLASALVKIAYGLAGQEKKTEEAGQSESRRPELAAVGALGIFDNGTAQALAISSYSEAAEATGEVNKENLKGAMRWDLWNPWAKWYELNSTHPLVANRLRYLSGQSAHMGQRPYVIFNEVQPESYWDEFFVDLAIHLLPLVIALVTAVFLGFQYLGGGAPIPDGVLPLALIALGLAMLAKFFFVYGGDFFPPMSVAALLKKVKVSAVRPVSCRVEGTIIGRGVPGYIFSEDFVMRDETGIIFLDYRQPLAIWEFLFGLLKAGEYEGRDVVVEGWYRRSPVPYVQLKSIECDGKVRKSWVPLVSKLSALIVIAVGILFSIEMLAGM
jgi:Zn-dependent protease with chaperone function/Zn-finger nucleic acid-binding protein